MSLLRQRVQEHVARRMALAESIDAELSGRRFAAASDGGLVVAEADHTARLVNLRFTATALTRSTGRALGTQVVQAVTRAQADARSAIESAVRAKAREHQIAVSELAR
ncbi:hypothetical protein [Actinophytocola sp.]|uniref:hypothetical protein n=1 Tax=Actinophytocola sp. TaxID=1872138 RepID=UPI003D6BFD5E